MTAAPRPTAVDTFLDTARYEHIPKKVAKTMLSINIDLKNNSKCSIFLSFLVLSIQYSIRICLQTGTTTKN